MGADLRSSDQKFKELILYLAQKSEGDERFGAVKLHRLLFYVDFVAYLTLGQSVTGQEYQKQRFGPTARRLLPVQKEMQEDDEIAIRQDDYFGKNQNRVLAKRLANLDVFSPQEVDLIDRVVRRFWNSNATVLSDETHRLFLWQILGEGETIPYEMALVARREPSDQERKWAEALEPVAAEWLNEDAVR